MIDRAVAEMEPLVGIAPACRALGASRASLYRRRTPPRVLERRPPPTPARALSQAERGAVLEQLRSERFVDCAPAQVWATLLDEGTYLASERTMYRLLAANGEVSERRDQLAHPPYAASCSPNGRTRSTRGTSPSSRARRSGPTTTST
jgi:putative transposase